MSITSCISQVAKSIAPNCNHPIVGGYTGRGILIPVNNPNTTITQQAANPRIVTDVTNTDGTTPLANIIGIENLYVNPFENSNKASNGDNGTIAYTKTLSFHIPQRGANVSKDVVEPLSKNPLGYIAIVEKKDKNVEGAFEVIGLLQGLKVNADGLAQDEATSSGDTVVTMSCVESWFECSYIKYTGTGTPVADYATTLAGFEALYALAMAQN